MQGHGSVTHQNELLIYLSLTIDFKVRNTLGWPNVIFSARLGTRSERGRGIKKIK